MVDVPAMELTVTEDPGYHWYQTSFLIRGNYQVSGGIFKMCVVLRATYTTALVEVIILHTVPDCNKALG